MLSAKVAVHDIDNVEAFVRSAILKAKIKGRDSEEREELLCEGIAILLDLAAKFKPHMEGYEKPGSFAGYCSAYLPKKIWTAWHKLHPEHLLNVQADGSKRYTYGRAPRSYDEYIDLHPESTIPTLERARRVGDFIKA